MSCLFYMFDVKSETIPQNGENMPAVCFLAPRKVQELFCFYRICIINPFSHIACCTDLGNHFSLFTLG